MTAPSTHRTRTDRVPLAVLVLVGAWLLLSVVVLLRGLVFAGWASALAGVVLLGCAVLLLRGPDRVAWRAAAWTGLGLLLLPVVLRYGEPPRSAAAYLSSAGSGLLVLVAASRALRR